MTKIFKCLMFVFFIYLQEKAGYTTDIIKCDVLIIGTGPIGSVYARTLKPLLEDPARKILMIDAGAPQSEEKLGEHLRNQYQKNLPEFVHRKNELLDTVSVHVEGQNNEDDEKKLVGEVVCCAVGGMSIVWMGNIPRFNKFERSGMEYIPDNELDGLYTEVELLFKKNDTLFDNSILHQRTKNILQELLPDAGVTNLPIAAERQEGNPDIIHYTSAHTILEPLLEKEFVDSFQLWPKHRARKLVVNNADDQKKIEYVIVDDLNDINREKHIYAKVVIVTCGAINTPQLLWNSDIRPEALGCYLTEHQIAFAEICLKNEITNNIPEDTLPPSIWIPASPERPWHSQVHLDPRSDNGRSDDGKFILELRWFTGIKPVKTNRLFFKKDIKNHSAMPKPYFECDPSTEDKERFNKMKDDMNNVVSSLGDSLPGTEPGLIKLGNCWHLQGTTRMGPKNDGTSVVDPFGKVWGFDNLFIGGNGVIPTYNCGNPTLTSGALALRSAEKILSKM